MGVSSSGSKSSSEWVLRDSRLAKAYAEPKALALALGTHLHCVVSLYSLSSSEGLRLAARETLREPAGEEPATEGTFDLALRDCVLPLSRSTCLRRSCILGDARVW